MTRAVHISVDDLALSAELAGDGARPAGEDAAEYALWLGDDALVLAQQLSGWITHAPELEEDVAIANIALDLLGHARSLLRYAGSATGRSEDELAYMRDERQFRSAWLFEQPDVDFAYTTVRGLIASAYQYALYDRLQESSDPVFAAVAAKAVKEVAYHRDHAMEWTRRLAGGTEQSRARMIRALEALWPYVDELFRDEPLIDRLGDVAVRPSSLRRPFDDVVSVLFDETALTVPTRFTAAAGGRHGLHFPTLGRLLAEMQVLAREHPGATW